ncbi:MAG: hypothetical protein RLZZ568_93 [Cyanobacteriota bacterium]
MQPVDYTTLLALSHEFRLAWLPARIEQVYQRDRHTLSLALRTLQHQGWLTLSWHPQAARLCLDQAPPRDPDTFTLSDQLRHQLKGLALISLQPIQPWERVIDLAIAKRPDDPPLYHLFLEVMGKYSNLILTDAQQQIITVAHQVNPNQSRVRTVQTGQPYQLPPPILAACPRQAEAFNDWQAQVSLIPGKISQQLLKSYRGVSPMVVRTLLTQAEIAADAINQSLTTDQWRRLFDAWQTWLKRLDNEQFQADLTASGFTVLGNHQDTDGQPIHDLIRDYYAQELGKEQFQQLRHQLQQKLHTLIAKLQQKAQTFQRRLDEANNANQYQQQADLLMAYLHQGKPGLQEITLPDFEQGKPTTIALQPDKSLLQNAQKLYKQQQKLKRAQDVVRPLLTAVTTELNYLFQVDSSLQAVTQYDNDTDWEILTEIRDELIEQGYLTPPNNRPRRRVGARFHPHIIASPSGFPLWIGRNNRQNDYLTFRVATEYDLWFHAQEIAGSHVLLRLPPGAIADDADLQWAANWSAYYSRGRESEQVPVVYTQPKYVFKPKGAKPGMVVYQQETVLWGKPHTVTSD